MALINCPECRRRISDMAETCPGCGFPLSKMTEFSKAEIFLMVKGKMSVLFTNLLEEHLLLHVMSGIRFL